MSTTVLVIEDDEDIRELLLYHLTREGYITLDAADGRDGLGLALTHKPDLVLLDLMLPKLDGLSICRELDKKKLSPRIPVIMLTARGEDMDRILGLELGADDYVVKPFNVRELMLRVKAVLRRNELDNAGPQLFGEGVRLDPVAHSVHVDNEAVTLTATEFRLLEDLLRNAGRVRTREELLSSVWGYQFDGYARTVDTHIRRLRAKLGSAADAVETIRGVGYRFIKS